MCFPIPRGDGWEVCPNTWPGPDIVNRGYCFGILIVTVSAKIDPRYRVTFLNVGNSLKFISNRQYGF